MVAHVQFQSPLLTLQGTHLESIPDLNTYSLGSNSSLTTAIANDIVMNLFSQSN